MTAFAVGIPVVLAAQSESFQLEGSVIPVSGILSSDQFKIIAGASPVAEDNEEVEVEVAEPAPEPEQPASSGGGGGGGGAGGGRRGLNGRSSGNSSASSSVQVAEAEEVQDSSDVTFELMHLEDISALAKNIFVSQVNRPESIVSKSVGYERKIVAYNQKDIIEVQIQVLQKEEKVKDVKEYAVNHNYRDSWQNTGDMAIFGSAYDGPRVIGGELKGIRFYHRITRLGLFILSLLVLTALCAKLILRAKRIAIFALGIGLLFGITDSYAEAANTTPMTQMYSGRLLDSEGNVLTVPHMIRFSQWTSTDHLSTDTTGSGTINIESGEYVGWQEVHTITPDNSGYFNVELGSITPLISLDTLSVETLQNLYLQVEVKEESAPLTSYELLDPSSYDAIDRSPIRSVPFSLNANMVGQRQIGTASGSIPLLSSGGVISLSQIPDGTVQDSFTIDTDSTANTVTLKFGEALAKTLSYIDAESAFRFSDDVIIATLKNCDSISTDADGLLSCGSTDPILVRKSEDESITGSTVLQDDDHLTFSVGANETWAYSYNLIGDAKKDPSFRFAVSAPEGSACAYTVNAEKNANASAHTVCGERSDKMTGKGSNMPYFVQGTVVTSGSGGNIALQWAQNKSKSDSSTIRAGSWLRAEMLE